MRHRPFANDTQSKQTDRTVVNVGGYDWKLVRLSAVPYRKNCTRHLLRKHQVATTKPFPLDTRAAFPLQVLVLTFSGRTLARPLVCDLQHPGFLPFR